MKSSFFSNNQVKLNEIDSTNKFLLQLHKKKKFTNTVVVTADFQTKGKGRKGNSWESEKGKNLLISILLRHKLKIEDQFLFNICISMSIQELIYNYTKEKVYIKWPNDIIILNKKIAGYIIDNLVQKNIIHTSIIGIGLNVNQLKFKKYNPLATSISLIKETEIDLEKLKNDLLKILENNYKALDKTAIKKYNKLLFKKGITMHFKKKEEILKAKIVSVDKNGTLKLNVEGKGLKKFKANQLKYML